MEVTIIIGTQLIVLGPITEWDYYLKQLKWRATGAELIWIAMQRANETLPWLALAVLVDWVIGVGDADYVAKISL